MAIFGPKRWVNFSTFCTSCCYSLERRFFVFEYRKRYFPGVYCLKKNLDKWPFLDQNHGLTPLGKCRIRHFPGLYCLKKKGGIMPFFGPKPWVDPFGEMSIFRLFEGLVFVA